MANEGIEVESEYLSRSELDRCLLAAAFATFVVTIAAHIASYLGTVIIQSRAVRSSLTWTLLALSIWLLFGENRRAIRTIPRIWSVAMGLAWLNALVYVTTSPVLGSEGTRVWGIVAQLSHLNTADSLLVHARVSSAFQSALALSILVFLWFRPSLAGSPVEAVDNVKPKESIWSRPVRLLAVVGIALPVAVGVVCNALLRRSWGDQDLIQWILIIAVFWWITGMIATGVLIIRDAIRRDR